MDSIVEENSELFVAYRESAYVRFDKVIPKGIIGPGLGALFHHVSPDTGEEIEVLHESGFLGRELLLTQAQVAKRIEVIHGSFGDPDESRKALEAMDASVS